MVVNFNPGKLCKDHASFTTSADVMPDASGGFTTEIQLAQAEYFTNLNYSAWANLTGGVYPNLDIILSCYPLTVGSIAMRFLNKTAAMIPAGTVLDISYAALGI